MMKKYRCLRMNRTIFRMMTTFGTMMMISGKTMMMMTSGKTMSQPQLQFLSLPPVNQKRNLHHHLTQSSTPTTRLTTTKPPAPTPP